MASYAHNDLRGLGAPSPSPTPPAAFGSIGKSSMAASTRRNTAQPDSFSDLASLMKAKKPYAPIMPPTPRSSLSDASNSMLSVSRTLNGASILSPTAKPYVGPGSVAAFISAQEQLPPTPSSSSVPEHLESDFERLEAMIRSINDSPIEEEPRLDYQAPSPSPPLPPPPPNSPQTHPLLPGPQSLSHRGPAYPPTLAESTRLPAPGYQDEPETAVRLAKHVWNALSNDITTLSQDKQELEDQLASLELDQQTRRNQDHDVDAQLGRLRYQNEANREQKAEMGRSLAQKDVQIKEYEIEIENFLKKIVAFQAEIYRLGKLVGEAEWLRTTIKEKDAAHAREIEDKDATVRRLEEANERLTRERDAATQAQVHAGNHATHAQNLVDVLSQREKFINGLREKLLVEQMHNTELEDKNDRLQEKVDEANVDDLKKQLREKSSQCDRFRNQVKSLERHAQAVQSRLNTALAGGVALRGGAHIVAPHEKSKLPKNVVSCSECYAKNISCDNAARCRNCVESLTKCARWRCSVKHKLGECNDTPCVLPHDAQGWLVTMEARPEW